MKKSIFLLLVCAFTVRAMAQDQDPKAAQASAKEYVKQGDYNNAILVLKRALEKDADNLELKKDIAFTYFLQRDYTRALEQAKAFPERKDADVQSFQILAMIYKAIEERKETERVYRAALKKFPESGALYYEFGEVLADKNNNAEAIRQWEKGIEVDPNYSGNYYNAAKFYANTSEKIWSLLYGEIFLNLESFSKRTPEIKTLLFETYKQFFAPSNLSGVSAKSEFAKAYLEAMKRQSSIVSGGVTPESISAARTRFILDWYQKDAARFPFRLFDMQRQLLKEGMFEAYDQWIFSAAQDLNAFQNWTSTHAEEYNKFTTLQKSRVFKIPSGQYFNTVSSR
ncbi:MAG TPA: tetratricopeptide repeat protein [Flavitalea sp.]|nr:tetratricopeptide repeat protein [Flavitalea sp.]